MGVTSSFSGAGAPPAPFGDSIAADVSTPGERPRFGGSDEKPSVALNFPPIGATFLVSSRSVRFPRHEEVRDENDRGVGRPGDAPDRQAGYGSCRGRRRRGQAPGRQDRLDRREGGAESSAGG